MPAVQQKTWNKEALSRAVKVLTWRNGLPKSRKYVEVPKITLERYVKDSTSHSPDELVDDHLGQPVLPTEPEDELMQYFLAMEERFYGLRLKDTSRMVFQLAIGNGFKHPFNQANCSSHILSCSAPPF
jgi:hypothetical protein